MGELVDDHERLIEDFVACHADRARQRSKEWVNKRMATIGGSEVAALMGWNPYSSLMDVVAAKIGFSSFGNNPACQWGSLFEQVIERFVEIDCGTRVFGTDISLPAPPGSGLEGLHTNSPDGYSCLSFFLNTKHEWVILKTDETADSCPQKREIVLWEFKCPFSRIPRGGVPRQYRPQVWSGLALSPIAKVGVFVDAVFRKCAYQDLGPSPEFDQEYHRPASWGPPLAWGLVAVYAPVEAEKPQDLHHREFGFSFTKPEDADPIDFGDCCRYTFETMMTSLDQGEFRAIHMGPYFADGRGEPLLPDAVQRLKAAPPSLHFLLGVIPWKLFEVYYTVQPPRAGFLDEIKPLIRESLELVANLRAADDPAKAFREFRATRGQKKSSATEAEIQEFFDNC